MKFEAMTDQAIAAEIGRRIEQMRLEQNLTQQQLADLVGLSRVSYGRLESGQAKLTNIISVLRALGQLELVEKFIPETQFSPIEQLKLKGKQRKRASGSRLDKKSNQDEGLDW
jgi:transcriptional regulator with XRE-family HTH domain